MGTKAYDRITTHLMSLRIPDATYELLVKEAQRRGVNRTALAVEILASALVGDGIESLRDSCLHKNKTRGASGLLVCSRCGKVIR